ncbi:uncharacterized protein LOC106640913 [Copidosoma floridanum]|uniref:uncharacterized protein LOC106640913 n=1 Tax=Copidosoma floridanum TaxID=29053 RepID=UPI0006C9AF26|nr:uncharacterized protein LOC106640913 [Copidosoma floridanum]
MIDSSTTKLDPLPSTTILAAIALSVVVVSCGVALDRANSGPFETKIVAYLEKAISKDSSPENLKVIGNISRFLREIGATVTEIGMEKIVTACADRQPGLFIQCAKDYAGSHDVFSR